MIWTDFQTALNNVEILAMPMMDQANWLDVVLAVKRLMGRLENMPMHETEKPNPNQLLKVAEMQTILNTLTSVHGSRIRAAAILGIPRRTLIWKLTKWKREGRILEHRGLNYFIQERE